MKKIKIDSNYILIGVFLLITGMVLGISIGMGGTFALEGGAMATSASATSTNATATNATPVNATATNATAANASRTDNILYLNAFSLAVESAKPGEKVYVGKMTTGACNSGMSISFIDRSALPNVNTFSLNVEAMNGVPYVVIPKNVSSGTYNVYGVTLIGLNSDGNTFTKQYENPKYSLAMAAASLKMDFDVSLKIVNEAKKDIKLDKLELVEKDGLVGERINVSYNSNDALTSLRLFFKSGDNTFTANVLDLGNKAYFNIPSTVKAGEYDLVRIVAMTEVSSVVITDGDLLKTKLNIKDNEVATYVYNNSDLTEEIIKKLYDANDITEIVVNADDKTLISEDVFKVIIGTDRKLVINTNNNQIIFNGRDLSTTKAIDVAMSTTIVNEDENVSKLVNDGIVVNFVSNGNLPGNALVRLKATEVIKNVFGNRKVNVYYFDEVENKFNVIAENINLKNDYYEFAIGHNSKYILTTSKLNKNLIAEEEDNNVVGFRQSDNSYLIMICGALILVLIVIVIILVAKNKKGKN